MEVISESARFAWRALGLVRVNRSSPTNEAEREAGCEDRDRLLDLMLVALKITNDAVGVTKGNRGQTRPGYPMIKTITATTNNTTTGKAVLLLTL
jgi:hypothetical protein